ncbi:MAG: DUF86 domain-containing protein [Cryomorphaceae bacterium]|nr:MAG: DUF86 domain-containing protein [Cryomorphaceae bacterium]
MDKPTPKERLEHVLEAIRLIRLFVADVSEEQFLQDEKVQSAVQYQFLIIGEAIKHIDEEMLARYDYPWHIPRSFRNFIIHVYHGIKLERVYYAAHDLDQLVSVIKMMVKSEYR